MNLAILKALCILKSLSSNLVQDCTGQFSVPVLPLKYFALPFNVFSHIFWHRNECNGHLFSFPPGSRTCGNCETVIISTLVGLEDQLKSEQNANCNFHFHYHLVTWMLLPFWTDVHAHLYSSFWRPCPLLGAVKPLWISVRRNEATCHGGGAFDICPRRTWPVFFVQLGKNAFSVRLLHSSTGLLKALHTRHQGTFMWTHKTKAVIPA